MKNRSNQHLFYRLFLHGLRLAEVAVTERTSRIKVGSMDKFFQLLKR